MSFERYRLTAINYRTGSTVTKPITMQYDAEDRLITRSLDPDGDTGSTPIVVEHYIYDGDNPVLVFNTTNQIAERDLFGSGGSTDIAAVEKIATNAGSNSHGGTVAGTLNWTLADRLGSVTDVMNATGASLDHINYDAFGNIINQSNAANAVRFGYTGQRREDEGDPTSTGLWNMNARFYDPGTGRFLSEDPAGFSAGDSNLYRYVGNDVTNNSERMSPAARRHPINVMN